MPEGAFQWLQLVLSALNLLVLPLAWNGVRYILRTERRLAIIETKLNIPVDP